MRAYRAGRSLALVLATATALAACSDATRPRHVDSAAVPPAALALTPADTTMPSGTTLRLTATALDASGRPLVGGRVTWSTSDPSIALLSVDSGASPSTVSVTLWRAGRATITATSGGIQARASVAVAPGPVARVTVQPSPPALLVGDILHLRALATDQAGNAVGGRSAAWSTSNASVATVDDTSGVVVARGAGTVMITAMVDQVAGYTSVRVDTAGAATLRMNVGRAGHTATLLPDGRVLIYGGVPVGVEPQAEVYDPQTHRFLPADEMVTMRGGHPATVLPNGKLLFLDGVVLQDGRTLFADFPAAQLYDPASNTFRQAAGYAHSTASAWSTVTLLLDGRVLLAGWQDGGSGYLSGATELFDPATNTFSLTGQMQAYSDTPGWGMLLANGTVLFEQWNFNAMPDDIEQYDPVKGTFSIIGHLTEDYEFSRAVRLPDGRVLITGGQMPGGNGTAETFLYVPSLNSFIPATGMTIGRHQHTATLLRDGTVLITGGYTIWPGASPSAEIYRP